MKLTMPRTKNTLLLIALLAFLIGGCDRSPPMAPVSGTVTLDGEPLDDAIVELDAGDGTPATSLDIRNGAFSGDVLLGKKTLRFFAMRPTKPDPTLSPSDVQAPVENILPDRYSLNSTEQIDVPSAGLSDLSYQLTSE